MPKQKESEMTKVTKFSKIQILGSKKYKDRQDVLNALLEDEKQYSLEEVDSKIDKFMKGACK